MAADAGPEVVYFDGGVLKAWADRLMPTRCCRSEAGVPVDVYVVGCTATGGFFTR